jgi:alpha-amylase/alpha-mannosidase (GH57 family)
MDRYVCIHGHFYQPPRENPWLEAIEAQDSAYPYHDWNQRITAECYEPNTVSRILDDDRHIVKIVNNYAKISFNVGPTLLAWVEEKAHEVYRAILAADRTSQSLYSGHGSALAQAYNHMILPLANRRDKFTQVLWGIRDFERRFGRKPQGLWLPETAVDLETLDILAELGIRFTVLAPHQAQRVRRQGSRSWREVTGARIDPTMAYSQRLPSGRSISLFFYDGPTSRAVAFEGLLTRGEDFANRLIGAFSDGRTWPQMVHIATDGETYGHHHRHGDMALAYALDYIESNQLARLTNYGEYLEKHPPSHFVQIIDKTSWSCAHGVERWRADCGCQTGGHPEWNQAWRTPLREALDWLRDALAPRYEEQLGKYLDDPWKARDEYISVVLDRSPENIDRFLSEQASRALESSDKIICLKLLELQRHALLMYTSCGWFFDDLSRIETVQVLRYAGRAIQLAQEHFGDSFEESFLERLEKAKSNLAEHQDGRQIYEESVRTAMVNWEKVGAHYAVSSLFESYPDKSRIYCYAAERDDYRTFDAGKSKLVMGRTKLISSITWASTVISFGALHFGDHNVSGGVRQFFDEETYQRLIEELPEPFQRGDFPEVIRLLDREFGDSHYSLRDLFRDEQRKIIALILKSTLDEAESVYRQLYEHHAPTMRFLADMGTPPPGALSTAAQFVLNSNLRTAFENGELEPERIKSLLNEARVEGVTLDTPTLAFALQGSVERLADALSADPANLDALKRLEAVIGLARSLPFEIELWKVQNKYYGLLQDSFAEFQQMAGQGDAVAKEWLDHFTSLGEKLSVRVEEAPKGTIPTG